MVNKGMQINKLSVYNVHLCKYECFGSAYSYFHSKLSEMVKVLFVYKLILKYSEAGYQKWH